MTTEIQAQDRHITANGLRFHYREWGAADAPPLLVLHGLTGHAWEFDGVAFALSDRFRVLAVDQRGHGDSSWAGEYSPEVMADDLAALGDALELGSARVIGHSMGGVNGWWFAARHPESVERLAILDVNPEVITSDEMVSGWTAALDAYAQAVYADPEEAVAEYLDGYTGPHQQELRAFVLNNLTQASDGRWSWRFDARGLAGWMQSACASGEAHWAALQKLACPTLVIRAGVSPVTSATDIERMAREIPRARSVEIPNAGHDSHIEQRDALLSELRAFFGQ